MSHVLVVNCGSSSIKLKVFEAESQAVVVRGSADNVQGKSKAHYKLAYDSGKKQEKELESSVSYQDVFKQIWQDLAEYHASITHVAHRIVHGGTNEGPVFIKAHAKHDEDVLQTLEGVSSLAPLHNHHAMLIVHTCIDAAPHAQNVLCFDTVFHRSIPAFRTTYAISQPSHATPVPLNRYGFHGLSYASILSSMSGFLEKPPSEVTVVVAHLGSGGSVCLIEKGKSMNTSMGLTPLEGLPGGTRSGTLDPSLIFHHTPDCSGEVEWSGRMISKAEYVLNKQSGLQALTGTNDFGEITQKAFDGSKDAEEYLLAYKLYFDRLMLYLASYVNTVLSEGLSLDGVVFSGGIGEHSSVLRADVVNAFKWIENLSGSVGGLDEKANKASVENTVTRITLPNSKINAFVVLTDEELECAKICI